MTKLLYGYQVGHKDWSPYPRVNHLRKAFLDREYLIDVERFRNVTEAYQENERATTKIKCAKAFEKILLNATLRIYDEELILGEICAPAKRPPSTRSFPSTGCSTRHCMSPSEKREHDQHYFANEEDRQEFIKLCAYWKGKHR